VCPAGPPLPETPLSARLGANLQAVRARIAAACERAGRAPDEVRLLAVTKKVRPEVAAALAALGQSDLGESRVQELERKADWFTAHGAGARWHLIGHLQRNKARKAVQRADVIHSIDSLRLLEAVDRVAGEEGRRPEIYLEVKLAGGEARTAMRPEELGAAARRAAELAHVVPAGLMTMAPPPEGADQEVARRVFRRLRELRDELAGELAGAFAGGRIELSMGMSADLEAAVLEGADVVRVGTALYAGTDAAA
jgi:pyridoxal phosphate enzyme (YggS family)